jgi:hypothetical protein
MTTDRVSVKVRRLDVARLRLFQVVASAVVVVSVVGRRVHSFPFGVFVGVAMLALVLGLRAYRWLGRREIVFQGDHILIGDGGPAVQPRELRMWAIGEREVRLYAANFSFVWRFLGDGAQLDALRAKLTKVFGRPQLLVRRGSRRARAVAGGLALAGAGVCAGGLGADAMALGFSGGLVVPFAFSAFMILSQKVLRPAR